jgi:sulfatase maturation enzyme AslB (radical SAM superfamily)
MKNKLEGQNAQPQDNVSSDRNDKNSHFELGRIYREKGKLDLSTREFRHILNNYKNDDFFINRLINELEINDKKVILESKPQAMIVMLSNLCNINCIMCGVKDKKWELPKKTIMEIIEYFPYLEYIQWQGGEVFLLDYFKGLFREAARFPNIRQIINTNGLLITEDWAKDLIGGKADITFSIDGVTKDVYEYVRKGAEFEDLLESKRH